LLVQEVAAKYAGQVSFVNETFGASKLASRFGVKGYPAVFVDDVLVASPRDFGVFGGADGSGRYAPWRNADSQTRFKEDLARMIDLILAGHKRSLTQKQTAPAGALREIGKMPRFLLSDLSGQPIDVENLAGKLVVVEFWATWCVPCRSTLEWLADLKRKYGDTLAVVAVAVESPEGEVKTIAHSFSPDLHWAIADAPAAQLFGDITAVPTMFVFDKSGRTAKILYGAPPDLHQQVIKVLDAAAR
jgi:thiol-disulfide isomerase/thioredoxin